MAADPGDEEYCEQQRRLKNWTYELQRTCGEHANLVIDVARTAFDRFHPLFGFAHRQLVQLEAFPLQAAVPLQMALQIGRLQCDACSPFGRLRILSLELSGSQAEGLGDLSADSYMPTDLSDHDYMCELGPVSWADGEYGPGVGSGPVRLSMVATENPGFVRLLQVRQPACRHGRPVEFSADTVRRWVSDLTRVALTDDEVTTSGPASSFATVGLHPSMPKDKDMVPCLRTPWWPANEFLRRSRALGWPSPAVVENIRQFGVHLVPTGCQQSDSALSEWRLSFSRAEIVVAWLLSQRQRHAVLALKACRTTLGAPVKPIKSYFMKTSLLWLVQDGSAHQWSSIREGAVAVLRFLETAINARKLPCFFWADINLFRSTAAEELAAMQRAVELLRQNLTYQLMRSCMVTNPTPVEHLIEKEDGGQSPPEYQLRVRLARWLLVTSVEKAVLGFHCRYWVLTHATLAAAVPSLTKTDMLRIHRQHFSDVQVVWFQALLLLLPTIPRAIDWPRLEVATDGTYTWDASPLVSLLTDKDLRRIMVHPDTVLAWYEQRRPAGLASPLHSVRGLTELLLRPPLLQRAITESISGMEAALRDEEAKHKGKNVPTYMRPSVKDCCLAELKLHGEDPGGLLQRRLGLDQHSAKRLARRWRSFMDVFWAQMLTGSSCQSRVEGEDSWQLYQYTSRSYEQLNCYV